MTKFRRLWTLAIAATALLLTRIALAAFGFGRVKKLLERAARPSRSLAHARADAQAIRTAARRLPIRTTCLDQAVALWWLAGGNLRIGVRQGASLEAHAWVELDGEPVLDDEAERFAPFDVPLLARNAAGDTR